jgi:hypothetical protein
MIEITGNYWDASKGDHPRYDALVCTTNKMVKRNGRLVMGAGIAREFRDRFYDLDLRWGQRLKSGGHDNGFMVSSAYISHGGERLIHFVAFPTKEHWKQDSILDLIRCSALTLESVANIMGWRNVLMTRPGCGMGNLEWPLVREKIGFLDDRFKVISK